MPYPPLKNIICPIFMGALLALAFAPVNLPGFAVISLGWLFYYLREIPPTPPFIIGWFYGMGQFGAGVSWIYVSLHTYGQAAPWLAGFITLLFVMFMALYCGFFTQITRRLFLRKNIWIQAFIFSAVWTIIEWARSGLFSGFPWLLLGYAQTATPLKYAAPLIGTYGLSFITAFSGCLLAIGFNSIKQARSIKKGIYPIAGMLLIYTTPTFLQYQQWTTIAPTPVAVSIIQGNIAENEKWLPGAFQKTLETYMSLTKEALHSQPSIIIWPEGAIPLPYPHAKSFLNSLSFSLQEENTTLITGIPYAAQDKPENYYNAVMVLGKNSGHYFKRHLVPFGEYIPLKIFQDIIQFLGINVYETRKGPANQPLLHIGEFSLAPFICYEIAYTQLLLEALPEAQMLVTLSDDAWFGRSLARGQHLQIAEMRSLESGRYQIVAANNGISAIISPQGQILHTIPSFKTGILNGNVYPASGLTPFAIIGDKSIMALLGIMLIFCLFQKQRRKNLLKLLKPQALK